MLKALATGLLSRRAARRLGRVIPNPLLRHAVVAGATVLGPALLSRVTGRGAKGRSWGRRRRGGLLGAFGRR